MNKLGEKRMGMLNMTEKNLQAFCGFMFLPDWGCNKGRVCFLQSKLAVRSVFFFPPDLIGHQEYAEQKKSASFALAVMCSVCLHKMFIWWRHFQLQYLYFVQMCIVSLRTPPPCRIPCSKTDRLGQRAKIAGSNTTGRRGNLTQASCGNTSNFIRDLRGRTFMSQTRREKAC